MPPTEKTCGCIVPAPDGGRGPFGFVGLCAAIGSEMKNRTQIKSGVMKRSKIRKRRIVHDPTDAMSLLLADS